MLHLGVAVHWDVLRWSATFEIVFRISMLLMDEIGLCRYGPGWQEFLASFNVSMSASGAECERFTLGILL